MESGALAKLQYRVAVNVLNRGPADRGVRFLLNRGHVNLIKYRSLPLAVARFLLSRRGLSKQRVTEYLLQRSAFNGLVLQQFVQQLNWHGQLLDEALRSS